MLYKIGVVVAYLICGLTSAGLFYTLFDFYTPGLLFITVTIAIAVIGKSKVNGKSILIYYVFSYIVYLAVFFCTMYSGSAGLITGVFLSGAGAFAVFWLTNKYIAPVNFMSDWTVLLGSLSFLATVSVPPDFVSLLMKPFCDIHQESRNENFYGINIRFAPSFLFWQLSVGTKLGLEIIKYRRTRSSSAME
jgi:hypothetical protein